MNGKVNILDVVALTIDIPEKKLFRGHVGTVVEELAAGVVEVEFSDNHGETYATAPISVHSLIVLHYHPVDNIAVA